jgi:hypothetical protein
MFARNCNISNRDLFSMPGVANLNSSQKNLSKNTKKDIV